MLYLVCFSLYLFVFLFGSCIGSFLNVIIYRIPKGIPFWKGRSFCTSCGSTIKPYDLVPVLSYCFLRGRCRNCNAIISKRYPLVESITGLIALLVFRTTGFTFLFIDYFAFASILIAIAFIDLDTMTIPNGLILVLIFPVVCSLFFTEQPYFLSRIISVFLLSIPMFLLTLAVPDCFGGGDIKLIAVCGFMLGWQNTLLAGFIAIILGGTQGVILMIRDKNNRKEHFAFGPYLCIGCFIALLFGEAIVKGYLNIFGLN